MLSPVKVAVIDDVAVQRLVFRRLIAEHSILQWVGEAEKVEEAEMLISRTSPDVLILDVQLSGKTGFDLLERLSRPPRVVFASSWPNYAVDAFNLDAIDYLLKPVSPDRFSAMVQRIRRVFIPHEEKSVRHDPGDRICLRTTEKTFFLSLSGIAALKADGDFTWVYDTSQPPILACRRLGEFDELLPSPLFVRLDRSIIINSKRIAKIERHTRNLTQIWLLGLAEPVEIGRTATERLQEIVKSRKI